MDQKSTHIKYSLIFELSCTLSLNDCCRNTETACQLFDSNSDPNLKGQGLPHVSGITAVDFSVQHISEDAMFSTASWIQLFGTFTFFFSLQLTLSFEGINICVSVLHKPPGYHTENVHRERVRDHCLCYVLCNALLTHLSDARGGSLTEKFSVARFIVNKHPTLVTDSVPFWHAIAENVFYWMKQQFHGCSWRHWIIMMVG